jgi:hypothetical protein
MMRLGSKNFLTLHSDLDLEIVTKFKGIMFLDQVTIVLHLKKCVQLQKNGLFLKAQEKTNLNIKTLQDLDNIMPKNMTLLEVLN